jgi:hypothetical protein
MKAVGITAPSSAALAVSPPLAVPSVLDCLKCQLLGRRRVTCSRLDACRELLHVFALGFVLLAGWIAILVAFILAIT